MGIQIVNVSKTYHMGAIEVTALAGVSLEIANGELVAIMGPVIQHYLTGELGVDYANASSTLLMDVAERAWSPELCRLFSIPPERLAPPGLRRRPSRAPAPRCGRRAGP